MNKGYDRIAPIYDAIACIFSFNQINKSQLAFLSHLSTQKTCLILGGGTGYFLQKLLEENKTIQVTYVDASVKMIESAKKRIQKEIPGEMERVTFVCKSVEGFEWQQYDVIVCNYFLDLFDETSVEVLAGIFNQNLKTEGLLYITDFDVPLTNNLFKWSTQRGLKILYNIHRRLTNITTYKLPEIEKIMMKKNFTVLYSKKYLRGILKCCLYRINRQTNFINS